MSFQLVWNLSEKKTIKKDSEQVGMTDKALAYENSIYKNAWFRE